MPYIKYRRITNAFDEETLQQCFDEFIKAGEEIIYYNERVEQIKHQSRDGNIDVEIIIHANIVVGRINTGLENNNYCIDLKDIKLNNK